MFPYSPYHIPSKSKKENGNENFNNVISQAFTGFDPSNSKNINQQTTQPTIVINAAK